MNTANLSKLVLSNYFFDLLDEENIHFDYIISDHIYDQHPSNYILLNQHISECLKNKKIKESDTILLILEKLSASQLQNELTGFEQICIISAYEGLSGIGHKIALNFESFPHLLDSQFQIYLPFDQKQFLSFLTEKGRKYISLHNFEVAENIYMLPEDEELSFIDQALAEQPENIALINNPNASTHIIATGEYFEEMVKLSELLLQHPQAYHFSILANLEHLSSPALQSSAKKAQNLIFIIDQLPSEKTIHYLSQKLNIPIQKIKLLTPNYNKLTSIQTEYLLEQSEFDSFSLSQSIKNLI